MPLTTPNLDDRRYQDILDEALARIPVYTPEWTNFNKSDPGVTLIEVFSFMTESLLYRCNQIPERNHLKFLQLLNIPLQPASSAQGLVTIGNDKAPLQTVTLNQGVEVRAGQVSFQTTRGMDVLPIEARIYFKQSVPAPSQQILDYYAQLYASYRGTPQQITPQLYQATAFPLPGGGPVDLSQTIDGYLWMALLVRTADTPPALLADSVRDAIAGQTLSVGFVPSLADSTAVLPAGRPAATAAPITLVFDIPNLPADGGLQDSQGRVPQYRPLDSIATTDVFSMPGIVDVTLPAKSDMHLWNNIDPLEAGADQMPPSLDDSSLNDRLITWLRIRPSSPSAGQFLWIGANCCSIVQQQHVGGDLLPAGTGEPDQSAQLSKAPVLSGSVTVTITTPQGVSTSWTQISDLFNAGPEVPTPDLRLPPGSPAPTHAPSNVFQLDPEAGVITFGDGSHGARPANQSVLRAEYDFSVGGAGNVGPGSINTSPVLPQGFTVTNPVRTWGGADAETADEGERQISRYLQHRDRLVTANDFATIALRTPGVQIGRVEVLPAFHPELSSGRGGDAAGAVTLMLIPSFDPINPTAPTPTDAFLDAVCGYLDPRRLVTTEVFLRGPEYVGIWLSVGIRVVPGLSAGPVVEAVKSTLRSFLAPTAGGVQQLPDDPAALLTAPQSDAVPNGWPLGKSIISLELTAVAGRVAGVDYVQGVLVDQTGPGVAQIDFSGLQLPQILGIGVVEGDPLSLDSLRGTGVSSSTSGSGAQGIVQIPAIPEECN
jgi:hypothetical protein